MFLYDVHSHWERSNYKILSLSYTRHVMRSLWVIYTYQSAHLSYDPWAWYICSSTWALSTTFILHCLLCNKIFTLSSKLPLFHLYACCCILHAVESGRSASAVETAAGLQGLSWKGTRDTARAVWKKCQGCIDTWYATCFKGDIVCKLYSCARMSRRILRPQWLGIPESVKI